MIRSSPAIGADGLIYFGTTNNNFFALKDEAQKLSLVWQFQADGEIHSSPAIDEFNAVWFTTKAGTLYGLGYDATPPEVEIISPMGGYEVPGYYTALYVVISAEDNKGPNVRSVEARFNNSEWLPCNFDGVNSWWVQYDFSGFPGGEITIQARATDMSPYENTGYSDEITVSILDTVPPIVEILQPANHEVITGDYTIKILAEDPSGIKEVYFWYTECRNINDCDPWNWAEPCYKGGDLDIWLYEWGEFPRDTLFKIRANALDNAKYNNINYSSEIFMWTEDNFPPIVNFQYPQYWMESTGIVKVDIFALDSSGIWKVEFQWADADDMNFSPWYSCTPSGDYNWLYDWDTTNLVEDNLYVIRAKAIDNSKNKNEDIFETTVILKSYPEPEIEITSNQKRYNKGDPLKIDVQVNNKSNEIIDMYAAVPLLDPKGSIKYYFYPDWNKEPHASMVDPGKTMSFTILDYKSLMHNAPAKFTFYAAITEHNTLNVIDLDSVTISLN